MTLAQLIYIMEIYNSGSMNKAAKKLFMSQSTISNAIKEVEDELGIRIFKRTNKGISVTEDGKEFITQIRPIVEQDRKIRKYYSDRQKEEPARFAISSQRYPFCTKAFVEFLNQQTAKNQEFRFMECDISKVIEDVYTRQSDIGVLYFSDMTEKYIQRILKEKRLEFVLLKEIRPCAFFNKDHPLAKQEEVSLEELKSYPCVIFEKSERTPLTFAEEVGLADKYDLSKIIYVNDRATAYNIMHHTQAFSTGSGVLPKGYADEEICSVPIADDIDYMRLGYIKPEHSPLEGNVETYIDILTNILKNEK